MPFARNPEALATARLKPRPREPNGRPQRASRAEQRDDILGTVMSQPHRRDRPITFRDAEGREKPLDPKDERLGYSTGRLFLARQINADQLATANKAAERLLAYIGIQTPAGLGYGTQDLNRSGGGGGSGREMADATVARIRDEYREIEWALAETESPRECMEALVLTCAMDQPVTRHDVLGHLRVGLNALGRAWERGR
jgi:hypothetical protein